MIILDNITTVIKHWEIFLIILKGRVLKYNVHIQYFIQYYNLQFTF